MERWRDAYTRACVDGRRGERGRGSEWRGRCDSGSVQRQGGEAWTLSLAFRVLTVVLYGDVGVVESYTACEFVRNCERIPVDESAAV